MKGKKSYDNINYRTFEGGNVVKSVNEDPQKIIASLIMFHGKEKETSDYVFSQLDSEFSNIHSTLIWTEFKLAIYTRYCLPSMLPLKLPQEVYLTVIKKTKQTDSPVKGPSITYQVFRS